MPRSPLQAYTDDGLHMFVHSESVFHDVRSGLRSVVHSILLLVFDTHVNQPDNSARISRWGRRGGGRRLDLECGGLSL